MEISKIISESLSLAWKHKILWILALLLGGGMSFNGNFGDFSEISDTNNDKNSQTPYEFALPSENIDKLDSVDIKNPTNASESKLDVLGVSDGSDQFYFQMLEKYSINILFLTLAFFIFMLFIIGYGYFLKSWTLGALLGGVNDAISDTSYGLVNLGRYGRVSAKELIKYKVVYSLVTLAIFIALMFIPFILLISESASSSPNYLLGGFLAFLSLFVFGIISIILAYTTKFAVRFISLKQLKFVDAFKEGFIAFKDNFIKSLIMSFANCFVAFIFGFFIVILVFIVGAIGLGFNSLVSSGSAQIILNVILGLVALPFILAFIAGFIALGAYIKTYIVFTWSFMFNDATLNKIENTTEVKDGTN